MDQGVTAAAFGKAARETKADDPSPLGLLDDGLVRTTGWLQFGDRPISSGAVTALICLLHALVIAIALAPANPLAAAPVVVLLPAVGWGVWRLTKARLLPASRARNAGTVKVRQLVIGDRVRLYGSIGFVAQVSAITAADEGELDVRFAGGTRRTWSADHQVYLVELLD
ncbi:MAG TPA: hypothetical protein VGD71_44685 [Kribbella sp.]